MQPQPLDALALCLLLVDVDRPRYERATVRWLSRLFSEAKGLTLEEAQLGPRAVRWLSLLLPHGLANPHARATLATGTTSSPAL